MTATIHELENSPHTDAGATLAKRIQELNEKHAVAMIGGKCRIINEDIDPVSGYRAVTFSSRSDFCLRYENEEVVTGYGSNGEPYVECLGKAWLNHSDRREYDGIIFSPEGDNPQMFNLWRGFAVKPGEGDCSKFLHHIVEVICKGHKEHAHFLLSLMADAVQKPGQRPGIAVVLRGGQGTGKSLAFQYFGRIFGPHYRTVSHSRHLLGNFNAHLQETIILVAEEAFWAGDKSGAGVLKDIITGDQINIERKGIDVVPARNLIRLMMTSNETWVVPAGMDERRYFVLDVSDAQKQNHAYFAELVKEMENGGCEALLNCLLHYDYSDVDLRKAPSTPALVEQKMHTLEPLEMFLFEALERGSFHPDHIGWPEYIRTAEFQKLYCEATSMAGRRNRSSETQIGIKMKKLCPFIAKERMTLPISETYNSGTKRQSVYVLPDLQTCRKEFDKTLSMKFEWPPEEKIEDLNFQENLDS